MSQKDNQTANAIMQQILTNNKDQDQGEQAIQMPELALRCAQFFHSLSQYCLYFYKNYNREADIHKTKLIKKVDKNKKGKHDGSKKNQLEEKKARALRGQSEPQPPKKPLTAYILYFQDKKPSFSQKFPTLSLSELTKLIAKDWKDLKQEEKKPYLDRAADDRKRYQVEMNEFKRKYRLGGQNRQQEPQILQANKVNQAAQHNKQQQIAIQIEQAIKASQVEKNERKDEAEEIGQQNQDDDNDDDNDEQEQGNQQEDEQDDDNEAISEEDKIQEQQ